MVRQLALKVAARPRPVPGPSTRATLTVPRAKLPLAPAVVARATRAPIFGPSAGRLVRAALAKPRRGASPYVARLIDQARKLEARVTPYRPPGSTGPVPISVVERAALSPAPAPAGTLPPSSPFALAPPPERPGTPPKASDMYPGEYTDYENLSEVESETTEELAPATSSDIPDYYVDLWRDAPAATNPEGAATNEPPGAQLDPLDELEQYEELGQGGDLSQQELDTLKVELAQRTGATLPKVPVWPFLLFGGLLVWNYVRTGAQRQRRMGRRGWGR